MADTAPLTPIQEYNRKNLEWAQNRSLSDIDIYGGYSRNGAGVSTAALMDPEVASYFQDWDGQSSFPQAIKDRIAAQENLYNTGGWNGVLQAAKDREIQYGHEGVAMAAANPDKHFSDGGWEASDFWTPLAMGAAIFGGGALAAGMMGGTTAAAGAGAAAAGGAAEGAGALSAAAGAGGTAAGAAGAGGAATGLGGAISSGYASGGLTGALSSGWGALPGYAQSALSSMGIKGGMNVVTGQPLTKGVLQAGLMSGLGTAASGFVAPQIGQGLTSLGFSPETVSSLIKPVTTGIVSTGTGLLKGQNLGTALLNGMQSGTISYGGGKLTDYLNSQGLDKNTVNMLSGAGKGALGSAMKGTNPLTGALSGAVPGALSFGSGLFNSNTGSTGSSAPNFSKATMGDDDDTSDGDFNFSLDGNDYLKQIESDYTDPFDFRQDNPLDTSDNGYSPTTLNDIFSQQFPDLYGDYMAQGPLNNNYGDPVSGNPALAAYLQQQLAGSGDSGSTSNSFLNNLLKQVGGLGDKASANPLAAIAALLGGAGTLRNAISGTPNNLGAVDALMQKGAAQMNAPTPFPIGNITARDPRMFMQNYDAQNKPITDYTGNVNDLYKQVLNRNGDASGIDFWKQAMANGQSPDSIVAAMKNSDEYKSRTGPLTVMYGQMNGGGA